MPADRPEDPSKKKLDDIPLPAATAVNGKGARTRISGARQPGETAIIKHNTGRDVSSHATASMDQSFAL